MDIEYCKKRHHRKGAFNTLLELKNQNYEKNKFIDPRCTFDLRF